MKTNIEEIETTEAAETTAVTTDGTTEITEAEEPKKEIAKRAIWARAHKGIIEIVDPELRSQLSYYRKMDKQMFHPA